MKLIFLCLFILLSGTVTAQVISPENRIVVLGAASMETPADRVTFHVYLSTIDTFSLDKVYEQHKLLEAKVFKILNEFHVPSQKVKYSLFSVVRRPSVYGPANGNEVLVFEGTQEVTFTIDAIKDYPSIQEKLIRAGVHNFNSSFSSSKEEAMKKEVLAKAVAAAKEKAEIIASAAERKVKRIVKVAETDESDPTFSNYAGNGITASAPMQGSLVDISQNVSVSITVKVVFELK
ncbi:SIMPL domain-containing protein [Rufibacter hautae]|uniref:DUF541 domain-containing protein n=1 Tax=Rufibacter hautae TaxID=2595005 RepID=A0A5B6TC95_9BACT|nr:SIMPL domain-containing protein [Rufibacter hautae]KAA3436644.1 DUF541 domain-containing protein [Rufibacter hautae]